LGEIHAGEFEHELLGCFSVGIGRGRRKAKELTDGAEAFLFASVCHESEVADAHEVIGKHMEEEAADELMVSAC
jgi:hypothetical protein